MGRAWPDILLAAFEDAIVEGGNLSRCSAAD